MGWGLTACQSEPATEPLAQHGPRASALTLEREATGPYYAGTTERFRADWPEAQMATVRWSASGGTLEMLGERVAWTLPTAGNASLTATVVATGGEEVTGTWNFQVSAPEFPETAPNHPQAVAPTAVALDSSGATLSPHCELAFDASGTGHIAYVEQTHPTLWYATWDGTTWTRQVVQSMGPSGKLEFVTHDLGLAVAPDGTPHLLYAMGPGIFMYATLVNGSWVRERIPDLGSPREFAVIALDPSQGYRPTVAGQVTVTVSGVQYSRIAIATRTAANTWTTSNITLSATSNQRLAGEMLFDNTGRLYIPWQWTASSPPTTGVLSLKGTSVQSVRLDTQVPYLSGYGDPALHLAMAWGEPNHLLLRAEAVYVDIALAPEFVSSVATASWIEAAPSLTAGDLTYAQGKPYIVHSHAGHVELVTVGASGSWAYTELSTIPTLPDLYVGAASMSVAVRPTTQTAHVCYPANGTILFQ
ncbi:hypothetical protein DRW03_12500 [Corallococcus sp. H22C18031201]|nr:hypothetical protein DRW03_12500 [Corallococcus sp. H22C18031201]